MNTSRSILVLSGMVFAVTVGAASPGERAPAAGQDDVSAQIKSLLEERRDTLRQLVGVAEQQYRQGRVTFESVIHASTSLLEAELDLAETKAQRIALHQRLVDSLKDLERLARARHEAATATIEHVLVAKAARLDAEIQLLREQASD